MPKISLILASALLVSACSTSAPKPQPIERIITSVDSNNYYTSNRSSYRYHRFGFNRFAYRNPRTYRTSK